MHRDCWAGRDTGLEEEAAEKLWMAWGDVRRWGEEGPTHNLPTDPLLGHTLSSCPLWVSVSSPARGHEYTPHTPGLLMNGRGSGVLRELIWPQKRRSRSDLDGKAWFGPPQSQPGATSLEALSTVRQVGSSEIRIMGQSRSSLECSVVASHLRHRLLPVCSHLCPWGTPTGAQGAHCLIGNWTQLPWGQSCVIFTASPG